MKLLIKNLILNSVLVVFLCITFSVFADSSKHGEIKVNTAQKTEAWNDDTKTWNSIEKFWLDYANKNGGLTWGKSKNHPEYSKVKEFDTLLIELPQGLCLMQFYHSRWRRANDVQRWNDVFNEYAACPYVFE